MIKDPAQRKFYEKLRNDPAKVAVIRERNMAYYYKNRDKKVLEMRARYARNAEKNKAYKSRPDVKARNAEKARLWRQANKERLAAKQREYRKNKPEIVKKLEAKRAKDPNRRAYINAVSKQWHKANPERNQTAYHKRRALIVSSTSKLTASELIAIRERQGCFCHYCNGLLDNKGRGHIEHRIPLSRGGAHSADNVVIACSRCNLTKGTMTEEEFLTHAKQ